MDASPAQQKHSQECSNLAAAAKARASPDFMAVFVPRASSATDAHAACSGMSDNQLLALTDTASLTADQLDCRHHLLRHCLPNGACGESVLVHFDVASVHEAVKMIKKMSQRDLQTKFRLVYGAKTFSNNNNWLRRKLIEAIGVDPGKGTVKKAGVGAARRRRRSGTARAPRAPHAVASAPCAAACAVDVEWFAPRGSYTYQQAAAPEYELQEQELYHAPQQYDVEEEEDHGHVCEALLALGEAVASVEESCSEGSVPSVSVAASEEPLTDEGVKREGLGRTTASCHLMLDQQEQHLLAVQHQVHGGAAMADWLAMMQQHVAAASGAAGGDVAQIQAAAAAAAAMHHPVLAAGMGHMVVGWPGVPMMFPAPGMQHSVFSTLCQTMFAEHAMAAGAPPLFAEHAMAAGAPPLFAAAK